MTMSEVSSIRVSFLCLNEKKEENWLGHMTNFPTPTEIKNANMKRDFYLDVYTILNRI